MTEQNQIRQAENQSAGPQGHTGCARCGAEREERTNNKPMISWAALLDEAVTKPDFIHQAYSRTPAKLSAGQSQRFAAKQGGSN